jgi:hypothetical protein
MDLLIRLLQACGLLKKAEDKIASLKQDANDALKLAQEKAAEVRAVAAEHEKAAEATIEHLSEMIRREVVRLHNVQSIAEGVAEIEELFAPKPTTAPPAPETEAK